MPWTRIAAKSELPGEGQAKEFILGNRVVCVANVAGEYSAMDNACIHRGGPLGQGVVEDGKVVCPWHGWQYDPKSGEVGHNSGVKVAVYPLKIEGEEVMIEADVN
jgi:nitrite reductase (NADH) small subunit